MDTIKNDIKRAVFILLFLVFAAIMMLVILFGSGKKMPFPKEFKCGMFYHMEIIFSAPRSGIAPMFILIICILPYTAAFPAEYNIGYIRIYRESPQRKLCSRKCIGGGHIRRPGIAALFNIFFSMKPNNFRFAGGLR